MNAERLLGAFTNAAQAVLAAKDGRYIEALGHATELALDLAPSPDAARAVLDERIFRRVNAEAEIAEAAKFGLDEP